MKQVQEEHLCRDIHKTALALEKIAKALTSAEQEAPDINVGNIGTISRQVAIDMLDEQIELCNASLQKGAPEKDAYAIKVERASLGQKGGRKEKRIARVKGMPILRRESRVKNGSCLEFLSDCIHHLWGLPGQDRHLH